MINESDIDSMAEDQLELFAYWSPDLFAKKKKKSKPTTNIGMVMEFTDLVGQEPKPYLYAALINEEFNEWAAARQHMDRANELKELTDLLYVIYGYALANGWDVDESFRRVHANNMGRCVQPDGTVNRREDGKIIKNPDYPKVNLTDLV